MEEKRDDINKKILSDLEKKGIGTRIITVKTFLECVKEGDKIQLICKPKKEEIYELRGEIEQLYYPFNKPYNGILIEDNFIPYMYIRSFYVYPKENSENKNI